MTRDEKLEAMARAWCVHNGWVPDHCPMVAVPAWGATGYELVSVEAPGQPLWKAHLRGMEAILRAIEPSQSEE